MSLEENKAAVGAMHEAMNRHDIEATRAHYTEDSVNHAAAGMPRGHEGLRRVFVALLTLFPDLHQEEVSSVAEGDRVVVRMIIRGTHRGQLPAPPPERRDVSIPSLLGGVPPAGKSFAVPVMYEHRLVNGLIAERWAVRDDLGMLAQLGVVAAPGPLVGADAPAG